MAVQKSSRSALVIAGLGFGVALGVAAGTMVLAPNMEGTLAAVASDDPLREEHRPLILSSVVCPRTPRPAHWKAVMFQSLPRVMPLKAMWQVFVTCSIPLVRLIPALSP